MCIRDRRRRYWSGALRPRWRTRQRCISTTNISSMDVIRTATQELRGPSPASLTVPGSTGQFLAPSVTCQAMPRARNLMPSATSNRWRSWREIARFTNQNDRPSRSCRRKPIASPVKSLVRDDSGIVIACEVARECVRQQTLHLKILPLFFSIGAYLAIDVPDQVNQAKAQFPQLEVEVLSPIGEDPRLTGLIQQIVMETLKH